MTRKIKQKPNVHPILARVARFLYWIGWIGVLASLIYAVQRFGSEQAVSWSSGFHSFQFMVWTPFTTAFAFFVVGGFPSGLSILIGHLITRVLRLEDENSQQADLIQTLMSERDEAEISHLMERSDDRGSVSSSLAYEGERAWHTK